MSDPVPDPFPPKRRLPQKGDRYRHFDPVTGASLNGGPGKPRPSTRLALESRRDYQFGGRVTNVIGDHLQAIMQQTGESKSALLNRILHDWLQTQPDAPDI